MNFSKLGLDNWILKNINYLSYETPTLVQEKIIPKILNNKSVIGISKTGTGKTASFCLPLLNILSKDPFGLFSIILEPTRELAIQVLEKLKVYSQGFNLRVELIIGGSDYTNQLIQLDKIPHIIIATPGRLNNLLENNSIKLVKNLKFLILDEFDQLLNDTIKPDIIDILKYLPNNRRTLLFSATMNQKIEELNELKGKDDKENYYIFNFNDELNNENNIQTNKELTQNYILLPQKLKENYLLYLLRNDYKNKSIIIFTNTFKQCNFLFNLCKLFELKISELHSKMSQKDRIENLNKFKSTLNQILISTDLSSRGLDIPIVDLVINFDLPRNPNDYIHRVGRTARAGKKGVCLSFVSQYDIDLILSIEKRINCIINEINVNEDDIMSEIGLVTQGIKIAKMKIYESGFEEKSKKRKSHIKHRLINPKDRKNKKKLNDEE